MSKLPVDLLDNACLSTISQQVFREEQYRHPRSTDATWKAWKAWVYLHYQKFPLSRCLANLLIATD